MIYNGSLNSKNGSNTHITELANNMSEIVDLTLFIRKSSFSMSSNSTIINIPLINIFPFTAISHQFMLLPYLVYYSTIKKPDVIYSRQDGFSFSLPLIIMLLRIPYVVEINGLLIEEAKIFNSPTWSIKLKSLSEKINYRLADRIIAVTEKVKAGIIERYGVNNDKIHVIKNGANIDLFKPLDQDKCKSDLILNPSLKYVCFVGNLAPWQGVEYLVNAASFIIEKEPKVSFLIVGDGVMKDSLRKRTRNLNISDYFTFAGSVAYDKVPVYINASDVCVAPFAKDIRNMKGGLSALKTYEYMACGKPVVVSDVPGQVELVTSSNAGFIVPTEDANELAEKIITLLASHSLRREMGVNGRTFVATNHSWNSVAKKVISVCEETVN
jgi:glycosyltransferase involved in cell wall biosynthesis